MSLSAVASMSGSFAKRLKRNIRRQSQKGKVLTFDPSSKTVPCLVNVSLDSSDSISDDSDTNLVMDTSNASIDSDSSHASESGSETSFEADSEMISTSDSNLDVTVFNTNAKWIGSISMLEISSLQSHDRSIVSDTTNTKQQDTEWIDNCSKLDISMYQSHDMNMVTGVTAVTSNKWIDHCAKLDISVFQACDMNMVSDSTNTQQIQLPNTNNTTDDANKEWIGSCSKLEISAHQACDMDMVLNNRCTKENDDTDLSEMKDPIPTISQSRSRSGILQIVGENHCTPATASFSKISLKVLVCLFFLAVMAYTRFPAAGESLSLTPNSTEKVRFNKEIEGRTTKQEAEPVVQVRKGVIIRNIIPSMPGDGVVHF